VGNLHLAPFTPELIDQQLSKTMMSYWINFVRTGDPNGEMLERWPSYEKTNRYFMELGENVRVGQHLRRKECDFFSRYQASRMRE
jgi:carboxylesterase type B